MISVFDLFKIGIGPSSSHTMGPMKAASSFADDLGADISRVERIAVDLLGSLAWTGRGHGTDKAVILGLSGLSAETLDPDAAESLSAEVSSSHRLTLPGGHAIGFDPARDIVFDTWSETPQHPNTLQLQAFDEAGRLLMAERWCSVGGGFVVREGEALQQTEASVPYPYRNGEELLALGQRDDLAIDRIVEANERALRPLQQIDAHLDRVFGVMMDCIDRGIRTGGSLPGGLQVRRRAKLLHEKLLAREGSNSRMAHEVMDRVSIYAIAVNEENAAGGRVVTAPTNGAAGVVPAVLRYYRDECPGASPDGIRSFLLTATAIGAIFKMNASISGAEVGCQGEVGVACAMAAAGLAAALGASNEQIENAAEIGMEHHLGMTCDPVGGLVQIPCIERNAFGAVKAITAASLAVHGDGTHRVSLDQVVQTMHQTGTDMLAKYKETSKGGLAVNFTEC
jgi:L-serine dehydratase